jgi:AraC-like DNA-binding protein
MSFQFNLYSSLLIPAFIQGLLFSVLLFVGPNKRFRLANIMLGLLLLILSFKLSYWMLGFAGWYDTHDVYTSFMFYFPFNGIILVGPLLYFYFLSLTNDNFKFSSKHIHHLWLPLFWFAIIIGKLTVDFIWYYPFLDTPAFQYGTRGPWAELDKTVAFNVISYASFIYYLRLTLASYRQYRLYINQNFSLQENICFVWIRTIIYSLSAGILVMFIYQVINWFRPISYKADWYSYLIFGCFIYYLSIKGYNVRIVQRPILNFQADINLEEVAKIRTATQINNLDELVQILNTVMENKKPFLQPDITLAQLAKMMEITPATLSKVINDGFDLNFNDFVNSYRVKEIIRRLELNHHVNLTLLGIALESGFNSKATFNRSFKKQTGRSPKEFLDNSVQSNL